jgi:hypothetical protein
MKSQPNIANVHQQNILDSVQRRLDMARANGDANLISQLEREMQQSRGMGASPLPKAQSVRVDVSNQHRQNLRNNVQRRLDTARARGDQDLVRQLERELHELA